MALHGSFKGGLDLRFLDSAEMEALPDEGSESYNRALARNILRLLMMGSSKFWLKLISFTFLKAALFSRNTQLLQFLRLEFQKGFDNIFHQLVNTELSEEAQEQFQLYLSNCLNLLPYTDLTPYEAIRLPQWINQQWVQVEYEVQPIELTHQSGFRKLFISEEDRVFATGLTPISEKEAQSHLIFLATTYPAGQGFLPQINTDLKGFETAGQSLYRSGRDALSNWLDKQCGKIHVTGLSLGGSLALLLAIDKGELIDRVDATNPAGLHGYNQFDTWNTITKKPRVVVQIQADDPVSLFGQWKKEWAILWVKPPEDKRGSNPFFDHFLNYAGFSNTEFSYLSVEEENARRLWRNIFLYCIGRSLIYYPILFPYNFITRPICRILWKKLSLLLQGPDVIAEMEIENVASIHHPQLPRNPTMDIHNKEILVELTCTRTEINSYNSIIRQLDAHQEIIEPPNQEPSVKIRDTRAKIMLFQRILFLAKTTQPLGNNQVEQSLKQYQAGIAFSKV